MSTVPKIKLVQGDNRPYIRMILKQADGTVMDLTDATVRLHFRQAGTTTVLSTIICSKLNNGSAGEVAFNFPGNTLDVEPGAYEGEIEVDFNGERQTVYEPLRFVVRAQFN